MPSSFDLCEWAFAPDDALRFTVSTVVADPNALNFGFSSSIPRP
jgi:hypothetical protein